MLPQNMKLWHVGYCKLKILFVSIRVSIAAMKHNDQKVSWRKGLSGLHFHIVVQC